MGPPGIGKTTVFRAACDARNASNPEFSVRNDIRRRMLRSPLWSEFAWFVDRVYAEVPSGDPVHQRRLALTKSALDRARKIAAAEGNGAVLIDQSLCQRGLSLWLSCESHAVAETYFHLMPAPAAVFYFVAMPQTVKRRNVERSRSGGTDRSGDAGACRSATRTAAAVLEKRGVAVIEINADRPVGESVDSILAAMRALR